MLRVRLLGELALELDGEDLPPPAGRPARRLLAWLALHPGTHARSRVAARLWPGVLDESARGSLRNALAALRRALPENGSLVATREQIGLGRAVWVDVLAFEELTASGRADEALALARGDLLPDLDEDWVLDARDRHRDLMSAVLGRVADEAEQRGEGHRAIERSRERVALDPLSEEAHRALIRRLAAAGERTAALAAHNRFRDRVARELGVAPSRETRALIGSLRERVPAHLTAAVPDLPLPLPLARQARTEMVGRRAELGRLREAWDRATRGDRGAVLVTGEAGIGKSRLVAEWARHVDEGGGTVLYGRAYEDPLTAYQPFVEALSPWLTSPEIGGSELGRLVPEAAAGGSQDPEPEGARFRLFESVSSLLTSISSGRPVLLVLEDLHWADESTRLLLAHLARGPDPARLLVVGTHREQEHPLPTVFAELQRERVAERLPLRGLEAVEVEALIRLRAGATASGDLAGAILARTGGNPFFVEEILRDLTEAGGLAGGARAVGQLGVPEGVRELMDRRIAGLGADAIDVLRVASVLGRSFDARLVEEILDVRTGDQVLDALERAVAAGLVHEEPGEAERHSFAHALVRETIYAGLGATRRARLHARAADALERLHVGSPRHFGELAHHLMAAPSPEAAERGAGYAIRAGEIALAQLAYEEAAAHFGRAIQAIGSLAQPPERQRCELLLALGDAHTRAGASADGRMAFTEAAAAARALGTTDLLARAALGFGGLGVNLVGMDQQTVDLLEEALHAVDEGEAALRSRLLARLAIELYYGPSPATSEELSSEALELATGSGDERALGYALNARHVALWQPEGLRERLGIAREMIAVGERSGDQEAALQGRNWLVTDLFEAGKIERLRDEIDSYGQLADQLRLPAYGWYPPLWRAALATLEGSFAEGRTFVEEVRRIGRRVDDPNAGLLADMVEHTELIVRGRPDLTVERYEELLTERASRSPAALAYAAGWAWCHAGMGDMATARRHFERVARDDFGHVPHDVNRLDTLAACADACWALEDVERAAVLWRMLIPWADRHACGAGRALGSWGSVQRPLALLCATMGRTAEAVEHFEGALEANEALGWHPWLAWTQYQYAAVLLSAGSPTDPAKAARLLRQAAEHAGRFGLDGLADRVGALEERMAREQPPGWR